MAQIEIMPANALWTTQFDTSAEVIRAIGPSGATIHHIGSTAVPGLAAKDVIDIQLTVADLNEVDIAAFERSDYRYIPDAADHAPAGSHLPEIELRKLFFAKTSPRIHLHVRERARFNQRYALLCRDFLRSHRNASAAYEQVKRELAIRFPENPDAYYAIKDPVFDIIMAGALEWAEQIGWTVPPPDA